MLLHCCDSLLLILFYIFFLTVHVKNARKNKTDEDLKLYLGCSDRVAPVMTGLKNTKKSYLFKCDKCNKSFLGNSFADHMERKHSYTKNTSKLLQSKLRVFYLWCTKGKKGVQKPLSCPLCFTWHLRLDNHLKYKHKEIEKHEKHIIISIQREKEWCDLNEKKSYGVTNPNAPFKVRSEQPILNQQFVSQNPINYIPSNATKLTNDLHEKWNIEAEDLFDIYYDTPEKLLNAFEDNTTDLHPKRDRENAVQHRRHLKYVWQVIDKSMQIFPRIAFSNVRLVQDMYHNKTRQLVGKGGVEASTLKVRIGSLRKFLIFLRSQGIFAGISRKQIQTLLESLSDWNDQLKKLVGQRKVAIRKFKQRQLMTAKHLIAYGRSTFVQSLIKKLNLLENSDSVAFSTGFATDTRGYLMVNLCAMNGLRNSNLCNLQLEDVENYTLDPKYPGHMIVSNDDYKTSTIYGEKLIVIPKCIYKHVLLYIKYLRAKISKKKSKYLFITSSPNNEMMSSADVGAALTASFLKATVFDKDEYNRVSPTRMRVACATIACNTEGIDMGFFANVFMKNRKETTAWHYNVLANNRDALSMAMMIGNSFQVGDHEVVVNQEQVAEMTKAMTTASLPSREDVVKWFKENSDFIDSAEKQNILEILEELGQPKSLTCSNTGTFYPKKLKSDKSCVGSDDNDDEFDDCENDLVDNDIASEYEQLDDFNIDTTVSTRLHKVSSFPSYLCNRPSLT